MKFHHIGIACKDIPEMIEKIKKYMVVKEISETVYDANQEATLCMLKLEDNTNIELITGNIVSNIVKKHQYLYHTCWSVDNIDKTIEELISDGAFLLRKAKEAILFENRKVAFLMWDLGMIELVEEDAL